MLIRTAQDIGHLIRAARQAQQWSQSQLAAEIGSTQKWVSQIENGRPGADLDRVLRALVALGVTLDGRLAGTQLSAPQDPSFQLVNFVADSAGPEYGSHGRKK